ncbi:hypothetical protein LTR17_019700 [Elasticomyces elasticus]|nr:hypothetical protein LTR17_019700 [Elasticomyces elasticus]
MGGKKQKVDENDGGGAWGLHLFQSDWDYDHLQDLTWEAGLLELEEEDAEKQGKKAAYSEMFYKTNRNDCTGNHFRQAEHDHADLPKKKDDEVYYHIYANLSSSPKRSRQWLEKTAGHVGNISILHRMLIKHMALAVATSNKPRTKEYERPAYTCVLLGAAAMSLGCKLPADFLQYLRNSYTHHESVGLMRDALKQMKEALGPHGYKNDGTPWDFFGKGSKGLNYTMRHGLIRVEDLLIPGQINVRSPAGAGAFANLQEKLADLKIDSFVHKSHAKELKKEAKQKRTDGEDLTEYGDGVCGGCGAADGEKGKVLIQCAKCKARLYCGKDCQRGEWAKHKLVCRAVPV